MPFIPHTEADVAAMLDTIGAESVETLFDEIPAHLRAGALEAVPPGVGEMDMLADLAARADRDAGVLCFAGGGSYDHHIPAAVWDLVSRGEFMTAYTPYQAEASQGTLQTIYEYQTMIAGLTGLDAANASVYDGGSGLAEAVLMAVRANRKRKTRRVLVAGSVHPRYLQATDTIVRNQQIELVELPLAADATVDVDALEPYADEPFDALVVQQPSFFGALEEVDRLADWAHTHGALVIGVANPVALALLAPPGEWGAKGADIAVGDGQPLGIPMSSGGPYFGYICARQELVRQLPGRIIGRTVDSEGRTGYTLTLQAREQHIRRAKATSNICTNQGLLMTAGTIHMALMGHEGLARVARRCHANTRALVDKLTALPGVNRAFAGPFFHEAVLDLPMDAERVVERLAMDRILPGVALGRFWRERANQLLVCATEKRTEAEMDRLADALGRVLIGASERA